MNAFVDLSYADRHALMNAVRTLHRRPGRALIWLVYVAAIVGFAALKTGPWTHRHGGAAPPLAIEFADLWVSGLAIAFGIVLATGTTRWLGVFTSRAEALVLMRATAAPVTVATYLQLRTVIAALASGIARFAYVIVFGLPSGTSLGALVAQLVFFAAAGAAIASVALPRALARGTVRIATIVAGWAIAIAAALPLVADALRVLHVSGSAAFLRRVPVIHPGAVLHALASGDVRAVIVPLALAAAATFAFAFAARDAYPELYILSLANLDWRERARSRRARTGADAAAPRITRARSTTRTILRGALAFVWADAVMFGRRVSPAIAALVGALALVAGATSALLAGNDYAEIAFGIMLSTVPLLYITLASTMGVRLAPVLRMPLFWLGDVALAARLAAWTFGGFWRDAALVGLAAAGYVAIAHDAWIPLAVFVAALGLLALARTAGLAVFALLPNALDQRGPGVMLRVWLAIALLIPAGAASLLAALFLGHAFAVTALAGTATAIAESALLVMFAAWRLAGRVDNLSLS